MTCRVTQLYDTGVAIYFYFAYHHKGVETRRTSTPRWRRRRATSPALRWVARITTASVRSAAVFCRIMSQEAMDWNRRTKEALDPDNIFACGNQVDALEPGDS